MQWTRFRSRPAPKHAIQRTLRVERREGLAPVQDDHAAYLPLVAAAFPEADLGTQIARERAAEVRAAAIAGEFSGKRVIALVPGLEGKALGEFIAAFKQSLPGFEAWVLATPEEEIHDAVLAFAESRGRR